MVGLIGILMCAWIIFLQVRVHFLEKEVEAIKTWKPFVEAIELMEGIKNQEKVEELWKQGKFEELRKL